MNSSFPLRTALFLLRRGAVCAAIAALLASFPTLRAATVTWNGNGSDNHWSTGLNWAGGTAPVAADSLVFSGTPTQRTSTMDLGFSGLGSLQFSGVTAFTLTGGAVGFSGGISNVANIQTLSFSQLNVTSSQTWDAGSGLNVTAPVVLDNATLTITGGDLTTTTISSAITVAPLATGGIVKDGSSSTILVLSNSGNTYNGGTTVTGGLIRFSSLGNFGTGPITLNGSLAGLQWAAGTTTDVSARLAPIGAAGGTFNLNGNTVTLATAITGAGAVTVRGPGTMIFAADNTYAGTTNVQTPAVLQLGNGGTAGSVAGAITVQALATLAYNHPGSFTLSDGSFLVNRGIVSQRGSGTLTIDFDTTNKGVDVGSGTMDFTSAAVTVASLSGTGGTFNLPSGSLTINQIIDTSLAATVVGSAPVTKSGVGTLTLSGNSTGFSGAIAVTGGLLGFSTSASLGTGTISLDGGGLLWANSNTTDISARLLPIGASGATFDTGDNTVTLASAIGGAAGVAKNGYGTLILTAANTYAGTTTVNGGLVEFTTGANLSSGNITLNGGGLRWATGSTTDISARLDPLGAKGATFDTNGNAVTLATALSGSGGLRKAGAGTLTLSGANTYTGSTLVSAGTLAIGPGASLAAGTVTVLNGATLTGTGTINGNVVLQTGATLAGTLTITGTTTNVPDALVFASNTTGDNTVSAFAIQANGALVKLATIPVGLNPIYMTVRGDQAFAYVANSNDFSMSVIDTRTLSVVQALRLSAPGPSSKDLEGVTLSPDGTKCYVAVRTATTQSVRVLSVNATTGRLTETGSIEVFQGPRGLAVTPDGSRVYVVNQSAQTLTAIDTSTNAVIATIPVGAQPITIAFSPDGTRGYVNNFSGPSVSVIDVATNTIIATPSTPAGGVYGIAVARDGLSYFTATRNDAKIHQFKTSDFTEIGTGIASGGPQGDVVISADGAFLYVTSAGSAVVAAYAIAPGLGGLTAIGTFATGVDPTGAATAGDGNKLLASGRTFVANTGGALGSTGSGGAAFTGGTLLVNAPNLSFSTAMALGAGGGTINTNGNNATITSVLSGTGAFTKSGTGNLNLTGTNTHTGTTTISAGTLRVNGSTAAGSAITVASGATLGGAGTIGGSVTLAAGGVVAPGNSIGTLNVGGSLTWNGSATAMPFELGASNTSDKIAITGALTKAGAGPYRFDFGGASTVGSYTLMTFASTTFTTGDFSFTNLGGGLSGTFQIFGNTLVFTAGSAPVITSPTAAAVTNGQSFSYQITASGATTFGATGLPAGLSLNSSTGLITGTVNAPGTAFTVTLSATTSGGVTGFASLTIQFAKLSAQIAISNLSQVYDGRPKAATIATTPGNLTLNVLYQSMPDGNIVSAPTNPGTYRVLVSVADPSYSGGAIDTLTISPAIATVPQKATATAGGSATFAAAATGGTPTYQWKKNGINVPGATSATLTLNNAQPGDVGLYTVVITSGGVSTTSAPVPLELNFTGKIAGAAIEVGSDIKHANGNTYDQVLLTGAAASVKADANQVTRVSYVDLTDDIVQVEFSGAGVLTIALDGASGPAAPVNYNQPTVSYMKGHATLTITGANDTTNLSVFAVGSATAINQALFKTGVTYDGFADLALAAIASADGKFGGVRTGNASYWATKGHTGVNAPGVVFSGPLLVGDLSGSDAASAMLVTGTVSDARVTGGDLLQANNGTVAVNGMTTLQFTAGTKADGTNLPAQANRARLLRDGVDVTALLVR